MAVDRLVTEEPARQGELFESAELGFEWRTQLRNWQGIDVICRLEQTLFVTYNKELLFVNQKLICAV